jgi:hypothetical protein
MNKDNCTENVITATSLSGEEVKESIFDRKKHFTRFLAELLHILRPMTHCKCIQIRKYIKHLKIGLMF